MRSLFCALAAAGYLMMGTAHASVSLCDGVSSNIVQNCGFEAPTDDPNVLPSWTVAGNTSATNFWGLDQFDPHTGGSDAFFSVQGALDGTHKAADSITLSQIIAGTGSAGAIYSISFYLSQDAAPDTKHGNTNFFSASFGGDTLLQETAAAATNGYVLESFVVTGADLASNTLSFSFQNDDGDWFIDDIVVTVPEAGSILMLGAGLVGLAAFGRRPGRISNVRA
ncbi:MAG TPA: PEP-CTERM sorting domain-containing protein [Aliidongia sp.]|nr:PEP-CTERM sorting domain-containing protein [Aliidongia sp.]